MSRPQEQTAAAVPIGHEYIDAIRTPICELRIDESLEALVDEGRVMDLIDPETERATPELREAAARSTVVRVNDEATAILDTPDGAFTIDLLNNFLCERVDGFVESLAIAATGARAPDVARSIRSVEGRHRDTVLKFALLPRTPDTPPRVIVTVFDVTEHQRAVRNLKAHQEQLELAVAVQRDSLVRTELTLSATIELILAIVATRDLYTSEHMRAVADVAVEIAHELRCDDVLVGHIHTAGLLHDVGKLAIPASILSKPGPLTPAETTLMRDHVQVGRDLLSKAGFKTEVTDIVQQHHERWDGSGYPDGLRRDSVCLGARILALADVTVGMRFHLPYRSAMSLEAVLDELRAGRGSLFDPECTDATLAVLQQVGRASK